MSLLQISEPGESTVKEACSVRAVGIDLGTTNSLVAFVEDGAPIVVRDEDGGALVPSVVHYRENGEVIVGTEARALAIEHPADTISSVKRFVGRGTNDTEAAREMSPYSFAHGKDEPVVRFRVAGQRTVTPVEVSAEILRAVKARGETALGVVEAAVITVPAYFDDAQRQATRDAGRLAGLEVMRLLAEPTAAALAYGLDQGSEGVFAIYDLGGGTFDISILKLVSGVFEVKATGGDSALGGDDFDHLIARRLFDSAGIVAGEAEPSLVRRALRAARQAKERLTDCETTTISIEVGGTVHEQTLTRQQFAELIRPLLEKTGKACRRALKDAELRAKKLDGVILVGGSTRSPAVRDYVAELFARDPMCDIDPEEVVALGAAAQAHLLAGGSSDVLLLDVIPLSLGIETMGGVVEKIIHRNSTIPTRAKQTFTTYADKQTGFDIHVLQGERETVDGNRSLARFFLKGIPPMVAGAARVEITFQVDADGLLSVNAHEQMTGIAARVEVKPSYGLTDEEVERMLLDSFENAEADLAARNLRVERVQAERILDATGKAVEHDPALLEDSVRQAIKTASAALEAACAGDDHLAIRRAVEALDHASKPFAEKRMNRAIRAAVTGKHIDDVEQEMGS